ncbi:MAG: glycosyltransferase [Alphaproteobacteria bacterium]|nr:glycosyltransferase [Alphaproteobacteria bacterium]
MKERLKILHAPTTVGGNPPGLSQAEKKHGYNSTILCMVQNYLDYPADEVVLPNGDFTVGNELRRWRALFRSLLKYNVFHYNFGQSIAPIRSYPATKNYTPWKVFIYSGIYTRLSEFLDLKIAKLLGRVTAVTYQGDDARQADYCLSHYPICPPRKVEPGYYTDRSDALKRKRIKTADKYADLLYALNPDLMNVLPARTKFLPYASVDPAQWPLIGIAEDLSVPHIIHAPSHRGFKGTPHILAAFERLEQEGIPFRYTLVENMPHAQAKEAYKSADILIDQVLAGFYGALAVELMAMGKPVVCYLREEDMHHLPKGMREDMPIINAEPDTLYEVLKEWLTTRKNELAERGRQGRVFAEKWHDPHKIARQVLDDYEQVYARKHPRKAGS